MQTYNEMQTEIGKLGVAQRKVLRSVVGSSRLDALTVEALGWKTKVVCETLGFKHVVKLGPKGAILTHDFWEK
jgi:hypothetical protein